jgi:hypothetical protein
MILKEFRSSSFDDKQQEDISCTRHFYASSKLDLLQEHCLFQRILIPYGNVVFESFQVSPTTKTRSPLLYQHYYMNPTNTTITSALGSAIPRSNNTSPIDHNNIRKTGKLLSTDNNTLFKSGNVFCSLYQ